MDNSSLTKGGFTLPGEAGHEALTLRLARQWGADVIRDSDGTQLSDEIVSSEYEIYSTLCLIRADNAWAKAHPDKLQQCCMMSRPVLATGDSVQIDLLAGFSKEQFRVNTLDDPKVWWQVFDRTTGEELPPHTWNVSDQGDAVEIPNTLPWHEYTVNFFSHRIWEEISMYNHVTNDWGDREHLMPIDPIHPAVRDHILDFLEQWLTDHPHTRVVRLTSMFYNFWWFWSDEKDRPFLINDWGSYEFTVSPEAIRQFETAYGYRPSSEDFVNHGLYNNSYKPPSRFYRDWINFIMDFVVDFGKQCIQRIHARNKLAFFFYNDHWIGVEPYGPRFAEFGFDGVIDGIFNGFETRKVAETPHVKVRELRMHPYLFPTGVNGEPSFLPGGTPTLECQTYWANIRRALLREPVDRIGFGGFLHLVENHPDFVAYIEQMTREFRQLRNLHLRERPWRAEIKVAVLTAWGHLRAWACRGHFNPDNPYNEIIESLSGLPLEVSFLSFDDILQKGIPPDVDVILNAGRAGDAWSGGEHWANAEIQEALLAFVHQGGGFIGVGEPSALQRGAGLFRLAPMLGVDRESTLTPAFERLPFQLSPDHFILGNSGPSPDLGATVDHIHIVDSHTRVLCTDGSSPLLTTRSFGQGRCVYLAGHRYNAANARLLLRSIYWATETESLMDMWIPDNVHVDCACFPTQRTLATANHSDQPQSTTIANPIQPIHIDLPPRGTVFTRIEA